MVFLIIAIYLFFITDSFSKDVIVSKVFINCSSEKNCDSHKEQSLILLGPYETEEKLKQELNRFVRNHKIKLYSHFLAPEQENTLFLNLKNENVLRNINIVSDSNEVDFSSIQKRLSANIGKMYREETIDKNLSKIFNYLRDHGVGMPSITTVKEIDKQMVDIVYRVSASSQYDLTKIIFDFNDKSVNNKFIKNKFLSLYRKKWNRLGFKTKTEQLRSDLLKEGYYHVKVEPEAPLFSDKYSSVSVKVKIQKNTRYSFEFFGNKAFSNDELKKLVVEKIKEYTSEDLEKKIRKLIKTKYGDKAYFNTRVSVRKYSGRDKYNNKFSNYHITINENLKSKITKFDIIGNNFFTDETIKDFYYEKGTALANGDYLDKLFLKDFKEKLEYLYHQNGFIFVNISDPIIRINQFKSTAEITYKINERIRTLIKNVFINGVDEELAQKIKKKLYNQKNKFLEITKIEKDIDIILKYVRNEGYYFARIMSAKKEDLVKFSPNFSEVDIIINVDKKKKALFDSYKVVGLSKTKKTVIEREIQLKNNEIITTDKINAIKNRMIGLGLFSYVNISPFVKSKSLKSKHDRINLFIQVKEKDFGMGEVSPGYRTDLGYKLGMMISYNNLSGKNRLFSTKLQANLRDSFRDFDARRNSEQNKFIEYSAKFLYEEPYLFHSLFDSKVEFDLSTSYQKRRFFSFDANIVRVAPTISKSFGKHFFTSLQYQLESIEQKDATELKDNDRFRIGSITPSFALDYRDNDINPRSGNHLAVSWEFANDYFGSMKEEDLEINYSKIILRNKNYIDFGKFIFASSLSVGLEKNYAREVKLFNGVTTKSGYIPSIKVFRLEGNDSVRGFQNSEINRISSGEDIGQVVVDNRAYFINLKLEPRYFINDMFMAALFFDAGSVYVNTFRPSDFRSSFGASLKVLTPVGSLDFDYGIKSHRKINKNGAKEGFGRFHVSIGFF